MDDVTLGLLQVAYVRRKRWEARLLAAEIVRLWSGSGGSQRVATASGQGYQRVSSEAFMAEMGAQWE